MMDGNQVRGPSEARSVVELETTTTLGDTSLVTFRMDDAFSPEMMMLPTLQGVKREILDEQKRSFAEVVDGTGGAGVSRKDQPEEKRHATEVEEVEQQNEQLEQNGQAEDAAAAGLSQGHVVTISSQRPVVVEEGENGNERETPVQQEANMVSGAQHLPEKSFSMSSEKLVQDGSQGIEYRGRKGAELIGWWKGLEEAVREDEIVLTDGHGCAEASAEQSIMVPETAPRSGEMAMVSFGLDFTFSPDMLSFPTLERDILKGQGDTASGTSCSWAEQVEGMDVYDGCGSIEAGDC
ncbi:hypothetical protein Q5P01_014253 [Channa striata]|uniref:Uncharacterized protein n=1 Tax=Channa striata TaxID=64152 RepID=A0AA88MFL8_CHASR|nr:hypothetical protein Q5P01_014253 [Channa striata]